MNSLESRIDAAIRAAADEVRPEDIPPLRLHVHPRGLTLHAHRRGLRLRRGAAGFGIFRGLRGAGDTGTLRPGKTGGTRSPGSANRWLAPLAAAISLIAVVGSLVVLRQASGNGPGQSMTSSAAGTPAQKLLARQALDAFFPATGAQYTTGLAFAWTRQEILAAKAGPCLAQAGFPPQPFPQSKRRYQLSFPDNNQFPDLTQRLHTHQMAPAGGDVRSVQARPWAHGDRSGYAAAARTCMAKYTDSLWRLDKIATPLAGAWLAKVKSIQSSPPVRAQRQGFIDCLESFGVPRRFATAHGRTGHPLFAGFFAWMNWLGASSGNPQRYNSQQRLWTPVFVTCARPTVTTMERLQIAARSRFLRAHARQAGTIGRIVTGISVSPAASR